MTVTRAFGVECKNPKCHTGIILGDYHSRPQHRGDQISFPVVRPGKLKCKMCGFEAEYDQGDLREFPEVPIP